MRDDRATAALRARVERPERCQFWGSDYVITPRLVAAKIGDGKQLVCVTPLFSRPNHVVARVDATMKHVLDEYSPTRGPFGGARSYLDAIIDAAEEEYGYYGDEEYRDEDGNEMRDFPVADWGGRSGWCSNQRRLRPAVRFSRAACRMRNFAEASALDSRRGPGIATGSSTSATTRASTSRTACFWAAAPLHVRRRGRSAAVPRDRHRASAASSLLGRCQRVGPRPDDLPLRFHEASRWRQSTSGGAGLHLSTGNGLPHVHPPLIGADASRPAR